MSILRGREMNVTIDDLHERIEIQYHDKSRDSDGNIIDGETRTRGRVWAKVLPIAARIGNNSEETENIVSYSITIRYRVDIEPTDEILWRGKRLILTSPPYDVESRRMWTTFECQEMVENGSQA